MRRELLDLPIDCLTRAETVDELSRRIDLGIVTQHVVLNASKVLLCRDNPDIGAIVKNCGIVNADGMSIVWAGRLLGVPVPERVTGIDLMTDLWERAAIRGWRVYLLGATQEVAETAASVATGMGVKVVGVRSGYWDSESDVVEGVRRLRPDILFLAIPSPQKELFLSRWLNELAVTVAVGVGGSFDVVAGKTKRAPVWMQRVGLEWLARLLQEPRRLARRYIVGNSRFVSLVLKDKVLTWK